jgi:GNAT superfamily N-acetyltransferase
VRLETTCDVSAACVRVRALEDGETWPVLAVFEGLGARSRELRFMSPKFRLTASDMCHLTHVDGCDRVALVAELPDGRPVGIARFVRDPSDAAVADMAVAVVDRWQRRGVGVRLTEALAACARSLGVRRFSVMMLRDNVGAERLMHRVGGDISPGDVDEHSAEFEIGLPVVPARDNRLTRVS